MQKVFKVGLIGCGHIDETYFKGHKYFNNFRIIKCADIKHSAAKKCASLYKINAVIVKDILKDKEIEIILNLTIPKAHFEVSKKALLNNKHVYTEKPMAIDVEHGKELVKIAKLTWEILFLLILVFNLIIQIQNLGLQKRKVVLLLIWVQII